MPSQAERRAATVSAILASARALFASQGFEAVSMDDIAEGALVAKGSIYHYFESKDAIFTRVLEQMQETLLVATDPPGGDGGDLADQIARGVEHYLLAAGAPAARRIVLIDGPAVIGWRRWREIDDQYFGANARNATVALLGPSAAPEEIDALTHLLMGAIFEAAMVCAAADDVATTAFQLSQALRRLLKGLLPVS